jgi:DNA adenine methylase
MKAHNSILVPRLTNPSLIKTPCDEEAVANPVLKWAGGKRQIIDEILRRFPADFKKRTLHEPMFGAGAVTFAVEPRRGTVNDINKRLMNFYRIVRDCPNELIDANKKHGISHNYFYEARARFNSGINRDIDPVEEASLLLYLNRTCYNGLYRENQKGEFNVPFGRYRNPDFIQTDAINRTSEILRNLKIMDGDFSYVLGEAVKGDIVYFDPPYQPVSQTSSFTSYHKSNFAEDEQKRLRDAVLKLHKRKVFVILSNSNTRAIRRLYGRIGGLELTTIQARRAINSNGSKRGEVGEVIVTNVPASIQG